MECAGQEETERWSMLVAEEVEGWGVLGGEEMEAWDGLVVGQEKWRNGVCIF